MPTYSQDTISVKDTNNIELPEIETLKPIVFKKYGITYYGFDTEQSEYIYNSLKQRDFYFHKYKIKVEDFNNIICEYDNQLINKNMIISYKDSVICSKDTILKLKNQEFIEKENEYKKQIKRDKLKKVIGTVGGIAIGFVSGVLLMILK